MHKSDELQEVVHTVFEKLKELNVDFYTVIIVIFQEGSKDIVWWMENKANQQYPKILVKYDDNPYLRDLFEAKENGKELLSKCYFDEDKNALYHHPTIMVIFLLSSKKCNVNLAIFEKKDKEERNKSG
jgi:hypothetical protein